eukprot:2862954-Prymnesium_polylepis.3
MQRELVMVSGRHGPVGGSVGTVTDTARRPYGERLLGRRRSLLLQGDSPIPTAQFRTSSSLGLVEWLKHCVASEVRTRMRGVAVRRTLEWVNMVTLDCSFVRMQVEQGWASANRRCSP